MRRVEFSEEAIKEINLFRATNYKLAFKVFDLIEDILKTPFTGLGKPEALKYDYAGFWSLRINDEHRLIYRVTETAIEIHGCKGHYEIS